MPNSNKAVVVQQQSFHSGPLPAPEDLQKYNAALPGLADRIVVMAEKQAGHRQRLESRVVWFDGVRLILGLVFGVVIAVAGILAGAYLISTGHSVTGLASILVPLGAIVGAFVYQQRRKQSRTQN